MAKGSQKKKSAQARIANLELQKRNGIIVTVATFLGLAALIALKLYFQYTLQAEWADTPIASMSLFVIAIVAAGFAGWGTRRWKKANEEIKSLRSRYKL